MQSLSASLEDAVCGESNIEQGVRVPCHPGECEEADIRGKRGAVVDLLERRKRGQVGDENCKKILSAMQSSMRKGVDRLTEIKEEFLGCRFGMALELWHVVQLGVIRPGLQRRTVIDIVTPGSAIEDRLCVFAGDGWALMFFLVVILGQR